MKFGSASTKQQQTTVTRILVNKTKQILKNITDKDWIKLLSEALAKTLTSEVILSHGT